MRNLMNIAVRSVLMEANPDNAYVLRGSDLMDTGENHEKAKAFIEQKVGDLVQPCIEIANRMNKVFGSFQQTLFQIVRRCEARFEAEACFVYIEGKVCEAFAREAAGTKEDWDKLSLIEQARLLPKIGQIDGLSSWGAIKGRLLAGYAIMADIGEDEPSVVGKLDPTSKDYSESDGAKLWLRDIAAVQAAAVAEYQAKLKKETDEKVAKHSGEDTDSPTTVTTPRDTAYNRARGMRAIEIDLPEMVIASWNKLVSVVTEALKDKDTAVGAEVIAGILGRATAEVEKAIVAKADYIREQASFANRPKMSREEARERLSHLREGMTPTEKRGVPMTAEEENAGAEAQLRDLLGADDPLDVLGHDDDEETGT